MSNFTTNPYTYISGAAAMTTIAASVAFGATHDAVNRSIAIVRANHARLQVAKRLCRERTERRQFERDLAVAQCDAAIARWHLKKLQQAHTQRC
ncbi:hypothetical protein [Bradyrhizobium diazoefficiens]